MQRLRLRILLVLLLLSLAIAAVAGYGMYQFTRPVKVLALDTPWTNDVDADAPLPEYPRPQLRRDDWQNLSGRWQYAVTDRHAPAPEQYQGEIVVPFAIESLLSGVQRALLPEERLWYRRFFNAPPLEPEQRLLLHFGAVDWEAEVWLNSARLGTHRGGYDPFSFDITDALKPGTEQELIVVVRDPTNLSAQEVLLQIQTRGAKPGDTVEALVSAGNDAVAVERAAVRQDRAELRIAPGQLHVWSPATPFLYEVQVRLLRNSEPVDTVESYFGAREVATAKDDRGITRLLLNGQPVFHLGLLDQGWWPDGLYTAPTDEALSFDLAATKRMGFNSIRKHVKVEPARWYWHADRMGLLVWQDMPTGDGGANRSRVLSPGCPSTKRGGIGLSLEGHLSVEEGWGYAAPDNGKEYEKAYMDMLAIIGDLVPRGLSGAIYTQTTDVESEINGLITYDRRAFKIPPGQLARANQRVILGVSAQAQ